MGDKTGIEWTDATWNPTTGCDQVSPGCDNCYALGQAARLKAMGSPRYQTDGDPRTSGPGFGVAWHDDALDQPLRWRKPRFIFVNSMSDLFHPRIPDEFIVEVFGVMMAAPQHTFQVLTKRPKRMLALMNSGEFDAAVAAAWERHAPASQRGGLLTPPFPPANVWLGVSVEDQQRADERIPVLLGTPAAVRFLSCEPLLGPVDLSPWIRTLDWVIVGGESGPDARPMHPGWVRTLRDQCAAGEVAFVFKQWGEWAPPDQCGIRNTRVSAHRFQYESLRFSPDGTRYISSDGAPSDPTAPGGYAAAGMESLLRVGKKKAGRELDGRLWDQMPAIA